MTAKRKPIYDAIRTVRDRGWPANDPELGAISDFLDSIGVPPDETPAAASIASVTALTGRVVLEVITHEAIVQEAYKDSGGIWTWAVGVTDKSGHAVLRYRDNPQPLAKCLEVSIWLMRQRYLPDVLKAFAGYPLTEAQLGAALAWHYNTGAILESEWVDLVKVGKLREARGHVESHYLNGGDLAKRRKADAALFFDGVWSQDGCATIFPVRKPSYCPDWAHGKRVDVSADVAAILKAVA
jgi:lysozyme